MTGRSRTVRIGGTSDERWRASSSQNSDQRLDPAQRPPQVRGEPVRQRATPQLGFQPRAHCCRLSRSRDTGPLDRSACSPPSRQARRHRRTDPGVTRRSRRSPRYHPCRRTARLPAAAAARAAAVGGCVPGPLRVPHALVAWYKCIVACI
jgi:hypothetical protein